MTCLLLCYLFFASTVAPLNVCNSASDQQYSTASEPAPHQQAPRRERELLVRFRGVQSEQQKNEIAMAHGLRPERTLRGDSGIEKLQVVSGADIETAALQLMLDPAVDFAEPNFLINHDQINPIIPDDERFSEQWSLQNRGEVGGQFGSDIGVTMAWHITTGTRTTVIAVIDSGVDFTHPELLTNEWTNPNPVNGDPHGWDFVTESSEIKDEQGHGTAIAGIIAAQGNNAEGISGVMWRASLMSLRVLDNTGTGDVAAAVEAIDYAASRGASVINLSWGTAGESIALKDAIKRSIRRGAVVVCSAGNNNRDLDTTPYYPAAFDMNGLISVAASDNSDQLASWSNWGATSVMVAAPGTNILTTQMGGGYRNLTGTSAAAPLVSGVAGLLKTNSPHANPVVVAKAISDGVRQTTSLLGKVASGGVVDASGALAKLHAADRQVPAPAPGYGSGGAGPGGSFAVTPPAITTGAPGPDLPNLDQVRSRTCPSEGPA